MQNVLADGMSERPGPPGNTVGKKTQLIFQNVILPIVCTQNSSGRLHTCLNY